MADYTLSAKITGDAKGFEKAFSTAESAAANFQSKMSNVASRLDSIGSSMQGIGAKITAASVPLVVFGKKSVDYASDLQEVQNVVDVTFGNQATAINEWAKAAGNAYGQSELQAKNYNGTIGAMLKSMGLADDAVLNMSTSMTGLAGDMASFYNLPMGEAFDKIRTGISGETEPLKQLGINMSVANLEAYALSQGINKSYDSMTQAEQATLRYNYLMATTADAQGDFARTGDSYANQCRKMELSVSALSQTVGEVLLPYFLQVVQKIQELIGKFQGLDPSIQATIIKVAALVPIIGIAITVLGTVVKGVGSLVRVFGMVSSPVGIIIVALAALVAGFVHLMNTNQQFHDKVMSIWDAVKAKVQSVVDGLSGISFGNIFSGLQSAFGTVAPVIGSVIEGIVGAVQNLIPTFTSIFGTIKSVMGFLVEAFSGFFSGLSSGFSSGLSGASGFSSGLMSVIGLISPPLKAVLLLFKNFAPQIQALVAVIGSNLVPVFTTLGSSIGGIVSAVFPAIQSAMANLIPVIASIISAVTQIITAVLPVVISLINQLAPFLVQIAQMIGQVIASLAPIIAQLVGSLLPVITNIVTVIMNVITAVMPSLIAIMNVIMSVIQAVVPVLTNIISVVISVVSMIISAISPIISIVGSIITGIIAIISPIITFIANIIATIISVVGTVIGAVSGVFSTVFSIVSSVFGNISNFISTAINAISTVVATLSATFGGVFNAIYSVVSSIMGRVGSYITGVFNGIKTAWNGLTSFVSGVFNGISGAVNTLVGQVKGFVNGVISGINSAISLINMIPGVSIGEIPYLLHGADNWSGGFARMNEGGRGELTYLPDGTQVIPHDISMKYAKESARTRISDRQYDIHELGDYIVSAMIEYGDRQAKGLEKGIGNMKLVAEGRPVGRFMESLGFVRG